MRGGNISDNIAKRGGVYVNSGTFEMSGGNISKNTAPNGGGVCFNGGNFFMSGGNISGNTAPFGGGVFHYGHPTYNMFSMSGGAIIGADNAVYLIDSNNNKIQRQIIVNEEMRENGGAFNITPFNTSLNVTVVNVTYPNGNVSDVKKRFMLNSTLTAQHFGLKAVGTELRTAMLPTANSSTVTITAYNSTVASVSFNLTDDRGAEYVWVNLTPTGGSGTTIPSQIGEPIAAGMGKSNHQVAGLTAGTVYTLEITPVNDTTVGTKDTKSYTAPLPVITFKYENGIDISDPLNIPNGDSVKIFANITDVTLGELKNEIVSWTLLGSFDKSDEKTVYPYNVTVASRSGGGTGNITVTVGGSSGVSKMLNLTSPTITSVTVTPATVDGTGSYDHNVTWTVTGGVGATAAITATGELTIDAGETATTLTVTALHLYS